VTCGLVRSVIKKNNASWALWPGDQVHWLSGSWSWPLQSLAASLEANVDVEDFAITSRNIR
jgi:hypothetical protein